MRFPQWSLISAKRRASHVLRHFDAAPPAPTIADAVHVLTFVEHFLRPLAFAPPQVDLCHASSNGLSALIAMAAKWEHGTPFLLTEHGVYLRERYKDEYPPGKTPRPSARSSWGSTSDSPSLRTRWPTRSPRGATTTVAGCRPTVPGSTRSNRSTTGST